MRIKTLQQVNERARDGRVFAAGEGSVRDIDDADTDLVDLMHSMAARGLVEIAKKPAKTEPPAADTKTAVVDADTVPAPKKAVTTTPKTGRAG